MDETEKKKEEVKTPEPSFSQRLGLEPVKKKCVCGKSKKYPYCDGSHNAE